MVAAMSNLRSRVGWRRGELTLAAKVLLLQLVVDRGPARRGRGAERPAVHADFAEERGAQMRSVAEYVATLPVVRGQLDRVADRAAPATRRREALAPSVDRGAQPRRARPT